MALITEVYYEVAIKPSDINFSLQVGDMLYRTCMSSYSVNTLNTATPHTTGNPKLLGVVASITVNAAGKLKIGFNHSAVNIPLSDIPGSTAYNGTCENFHLTFKKDCAANISSLTGYYASVMFENDDYGHKAELFAVNSQVGMSSK